MAGAAPEREPCGKKRRKGRVKVPGESPKGSQRSQWEGGQRIELYRGKEGRKGPEEFREPE